MANNSSVFQIPSRFISEPVPVFVSEKSEKNASFDRKVFEELNEISEEIEKCRRQATR